MHDCKSKQLIKSHTRQENIYSNFSKANDYSKNNFISPYGNVWICYRIKVLKEFSKQNETFASMILCKQLSVLTQQAFSDLLQQTNCPEVKMESSAFVQIVAGLPTFRLLIGFMGCNKSITLLIDSRVCQPKIGSDWNWVRIFHSITMGGIKQIFY